MVSHTEPPREYQPFEFTPDGGYRRVRGPAGRLDPTRLKHEYERLREELAAAIPEPLRIALQDIDELGYETSARHEEYVVDELCRHLPAMAAAIRLVFDHVRDQKLDDEGVCCSDAAERSERPWEGGDHGAQ